MTILSVPVNQELYLMFDMSLHFNLTWTLGGRNHYSLQAKKPSFSNLVKVIWLVRWRPGMQTSRLQSWLPATVPCCLSLRSPLSCDSSPCLVNHYLVNRSCLTNLHIARCPSHSGHWINAAFLLIIWMTFVFLGHMETLKAVCDYTVSRLLPNSQENRK